MKDVNYDFEATEITCDNETDCDKALSINSCDYTEINKELKSFNWLVKKIDGNWCEFCSVACLKKY